MSMWDDLMSSLSNAENASPEVRNGGVHRSSAVPSTLSIKLSPRRSPFPSPSAIGSMSPQFFYDNVSPVAANAPFPVPSHSAAPSVPSEFLPHPSFRNYNQNASLQQRMSLPPQPQNYPYYLPRVASSKDIKQEENYHHFQDLDHLSPSPYQQGRTFNWVDMNGRDDTSHTSGNASPFPTQQLDQESFSPEQLRSLLQAINDGSISLPTSPPLTPSTSNARPVARSRHYTTGGVTAGTASPGSSTTHKTRVAATSSARVVDGSKHLPGTPEYKKRRYTLPDSLRAYQKSLEDDAVDGSDQSSPFASTSHTPVSTTPKNKSVGSKNTKRHCPKIEDVESDVSDYGNEGGPSNTSSSVAGDQDSDMAVDKTSSRRSSGPSQSRNRNQNASTHPSTSTSSSETISCKVGGVELAIIRQPESHHRARYQKEGSRGCMKDRTGSSCPSIQLKGYHGMNMLLHAYIGTETDPIRPHPLYRVCKVGGKHSTPCREKVLDDGITCLEMDMTRDNNYTLNIDCLGILKLRNADFDPTVVDTEEMTKRRKRSPKVRLVMRCPDVQLPDGSLKTLQVISSPISCTPSPGVPEIHFISHNTCSAGGGMDVVVIGRNYVKDDSRLYIAEKTNVTLNNSDGGEGENVETPNRWEQEVTLLQEHFSPVHLVGTIPPYYDADMAEPVDVLIFVRNKGGKTSDGYPFRYTPVDHSEEARRRRSPSSTKTPLSASPAPSSRVEPAEAEPSEEPMNLSSEVDSLPVERIVNQPIPIQPRPQPSPLPQQLIMATPSSMTSQVVEGGQLQYCIQLPGIVQPIIITIPQNQLRQQGVVGQPMVGVQSVLPPPAYSTVPVSNQTGYNHQLPLMGNPTNLQQYQSDLQGQQYPPNKVELLDTVVASSSMMRSDGSSNINPSAVGPRDEDLFDELLKEILGPDSDMSEMMALMQQEGILATAAGGTQLSRNANINPADALNSFLSMNINKQRQHNSDGSL